MFRITNRRIKSALSILATPVVACSAVYVCYKLSKFLWSRFWDTNGAYRYEYMNQYKSYFVTLLIEAMTFSFPDPSLDLSMRDAFRASPLLPDPKETTDLRKTHAKSNSQRARAEQFMNTFCGSKALSRYDVSTNISRVKSRGSRFYHHLADLVMPMLYDDIHPNTMFTFVDVDYYVNLEYWARHFRPMMLYSFQPTVLCGMDVDRHFYPKGDDFFVVAEGCDPYLHEVYNWSTNFVTFNHGLTMSVYRVERRRLSDHRELIMLTPIRLLSIFGSFFFWNSLNRLKTLDGTSHTLRVYSNETEIVSLCPPDSHVSVELPRRLYDAMLSALRNPSFRNAGSIENHMNIAGFDAPTRTTASHLLLNWYAHRKGIDTFVYMPPNFHFTAMSESTIDFTKTTMTHWAKPFVTQTAVAPLKTESNTKMMLRGRLQVPAKQAVELKATPTWFMPRAKEFIDLCFPDPLIPMTYDSFMQEVKTSVKYEALNRELINGGQNWEDAHGVYKGIFPKAESYSAVKYPRIISNPKPILKLLYGIYVKQLGNNLKNCPWYAFSSKPLELSAKMNTLLQRDGPVTGTDFTTFDATINWSARLFERLLLLTVFKCDSRVLALHESQFYQWLSTNDRSTSAFYTFQRQSGSPETSIFNTLYNAFVSYVAYTGMGLEPREAYESLGIYGGDDGVNVGMPQSVHSKTCSSLGLLVKTESFEVGRPVLFLGRYWALGDVYANSICDIDRMIGKLHLTTHKNVPASQICIEKCLGYLVTDFMTPMVSDILLHMAILAMEVDNSAFYTIIDCPIYDYKPFVVPRATLQDLAAQAYKVNPCDRKPWVDNCFVNSKDDWQTTMINPDSFYTFCENVASLDSFEALINYPSSETYNNNTGKKSAFTTISLNGTDEIVPLDPVDSKAENKEKIYNAAVAYIMGNTALGIRVTNDDIVHVVPFTEKQRRVLNRLLQDNRNAIKKTSSKFEPMARVLQEGSLIMEQDDSWKNLDRQSYSGEKLSNRDRERAGYVKRPTTAPRTTAGLQSFKKSLYENYHPPEVPLTRMENGTFVTGHPAQTYSRDKANRSNKSAREPPKGFPTIAEPHSKISKGKTEDEQTIYQQLMNPPPLIYPDNFDLENWENEDAEPHYSRPNIKNNKYSRPKLGRPKTEFRGHGRGSARRGKP